MSKPGEIKLYEAGQYALDLLTRIKIASIIISNMVERALSFIMLLLIASQNLASSILYAQHQVFPIKSIKIDSKVSRKVNPEHGCCCCCKNKNSSSLMACCRESKTPLASPITRICCETGGEPTGDSAAVKTSDFTVQKLPAPKLTALPGVEDNVLTNLLYAGKRCAQADIHLETPLLYLHNAAFLI